MLYKPNFNIFIWKELNFMLLKGTVKTVSIECSLAKFKVWQLQFSSYNEGELNNSFLRKFILGLSNRFQILQTFENVSICLWWKVRGFKRR
jgi:hypothetical protein